VFETEDGSVTGLVELSVTLAVAVPEVELETAGEETGRVGNVTGVTAEPEGDDKGVVSAPSVAAELDTEPEVEFVTGTWLGRVWVRRVVGAVEIVGGTEAEMVVLFERAVLEEYDERIAELADEASETGHTV